MITAVVDFLAFWRNSVVVPPEGRATVEDLLVPLLSLPGCLALVATAVLTILTLVALWVVARQFGGPRYALGHVFVAAILSPIFLVGPFAVSELVLGDIRRSGDVVEDGRAQSGPASDATTEE